MIDCSSLLRTIDSKTPYNVQLTGFYKRSFAHYTVKERMPVILTKVIDSLVRDKETIANKYGEESKEELKYVIGELSKLKYEIQTNKPISKLRGDSADIHVYNDYLEKRATEEGHPTYFNTVWLFSECYMYRRLKNVFEMTNTLKDYDPFKKQKENAFISSLPAIESLGKYLENILSNTLEVNQIKHEFIKLIKINLWGNKCDLSLSLGKEKSEQMDPEMIINNYESYILVDQSELIWDIVSKTSQDEIVDIINDNTGYEIFTDFCIADFLISHNLAKKIRFYVKVLPWFVSDVLPEDFNWTLNALKDNEVLKALGEKWCNYIKNGQWTLEAESFWTLPYDYSIMKENHKCLYSKLSEAKLIMFKGDLNYRKLLAETNWEPTTTFEKALQGFGPSNLCTLRTVKADLICGLPHGKAEEVNQIDPEWMINGNWGVIQCWQMN